jgi:hypothetical protein
MEFADYHAINKLINRYAQYADNGDFESLAAHYARCKLIFPNGDVFDVAARGPTAYLDWYNRLIRVYPERRTPKTRRMVGTIIIDDDGPNRATSQCCIICFQATDKLPLQPIAAATLYDRFEKTDGAWWLVERREDLELVGDLSQHVNFDAVGIP